MTALERLLAEVGPAADGPGVLVRVGIDVAWVDEVAGSLRTFGDRYVRRLFTEHEADCAGWSGADDRRSGRDPRLTAEMLAARFAAKEATVKVLRPTGARPPWRSIEVRRAPEGWCTLHLDGAAADLADRAGVRDLAVSLTHDGGSAAAVVVAVCQGGTRNVEEVA